MTRIEDIAFWNAHRDVRRMAQRQGGCPRCCEQLAFAATDVLEGKQARKVELCAKCIKRGLGGNSHG